MRISKSKINNELISSLTKDKFFDLNLIGHQPPGSVFLKAQNDHNGFYLSWRIVEKPEGYEIDQLSPKLEIYKLEKFIAHLSKDNGLEKLYDNISMYDKLETNRDLFLKLCTKRISSEEDLPEILILFLEFYEKEIKTFYKTKNTIINLSDKMKNVPFSQLAEMGIGGKYPINILKAITIVKWGGNVEKYNEYKTGLQAWIDKDRTNPKYAEELIYIKGH